MVVWVFQWGHLSGLLRFTPTGSIDPTMPILMAAIIFGLSMDYEVFLLSRIRERYDQTGDNTVAVAAGLQRTGGVITSLALLLIIVVGAFSASGITFIKLMGVGMIVALIVDASVVRVMLVPATMRLLGRANWWAPRPLRRLYARYGFKEDGPGAVPVPAAASRDYPRPGHRPGLVISPALPSHGCLTGLAISPALPSHCPGYCPGPRPRRPVAAIAAKARPGRAACLFSYVVRSGSVNRTFLLSSPRRQDGPEST